MHSIGQNVLLIYPPFGIDFLQPPRFLNSEDLETVKLDYFQMVNVQYFQQEKIFHRYLVGIHIAAVSCCISFLFVDSKYTGNLYTLMTLYGSFLTST